MMRTFRSLAALLTLSLPLAGAAAQEGDMMEQSMPDLVYVEMETSKGDILIELNHAKAPVSVANFLRYVEDDYYDGTVFHRVIGNFMIQGGGFTSNGEKKTTRDPIVNEWQNGLSNRRGTIAMARLGGQADSATSQFFINVKDNAVALEVAAAYAERQSVLAELEYIERATESAAEGYRVAVDLYQVGEATTTDILDAEYDQVDATLRNINAKIDLRAADLKLLYATGRLEPISAEIGADLGE